MMPFVGFGTYKLKKGEATGPILEALKTGYRLIDTASVYENEVDVGVALRQSALLRGDVIIQTKHWRSSHGYERTLKLCNQSLKKLKVSYIDVYLIHWPGCKVGWPLKQGTTSPVDWTPSMRDEGTWRAMEQLYDEGKIRALGVCNYTIRHLQQLLKTCRIRPMVNQVEFHPLLVQTELLEFCKREGIVLQAYASLGSGDAKKAADFFALPPVRAAAEAHGVTSAQVLLRWAIQKGCHVVPKSSRPERMQENAQVFHFSLTQKEIDGIDKLHSNTRFAWKGVDPETIE
jgi:diketogulonate reductase-like aldo/keto reductase